MTGNYLFKIKTTYLFLFFFFSTQIVFSQLYFFGRNKVQYEKFDWKIIKTEHFDIYYYDEFDEMAEFGAKYAEEAFEELKVKFNHLIVSRIPLIFYNTHQHFQQTNTTPGFIPEGVGGFFEFLKGRVVIPYLGSLEQFRHVIRHELVHVFMTSKVLNGLREHRVIADRYPPLWFVEGLAEYWSYYWDSKAEMVLRDAVLNGIFVPLEYLDRINGTYLMYKEGQNFLYFVSETYGEDKILQLLENFWRFPIFDDNLEFTLGDKISTIDDKWSYWLKKQYYPLYDKKYPHHIGAERLTEKGFNYSPAYYEKDGIRSVFYIGNIDGYSSIYRLDYDLNLQDYAEPEVIIKGEKEDIYEAFHLLQPSLAVSHNGLMAFITKSEGQDVIHLYDVNSRENIKTLRYKNLLSIQSPSFSHDGNKLIFSAIDRKGYVDIFAVDLQKMDLIRYTNDYYSDNYPVYDKKTDNIYFVSDRTEGRYKQKSNIFKLNTTDFTIEYITYTDSDFADLEFNPDYSSLYFTTDIDSTFNLWRIEDIANNSNIEIQQLTDFVTPMFGFSFVNEKTLITTGFERFSFNFYSLDLKTLEEENNRTIKMEFDVNAERWKPDRIVVAPEDKEVSYKREYTMDYAVSQVIADPVYGTRGGAVFLLSDLMGDDKYYFMMYNNAEVQSEILKSWNVAVTKINSKYRTNFGYGIFHYSGRRYDIRESNEFFFERSFGGFFSLIYPFSMFKRIEASVSLANSDKQLDLINFSRKSILLSNSISFVHDNALWLAGGPIDGSRLRVLLGYTTDIKYSNVNYYSVIADYRHYYRTGMFSALAGRAAIFINEGKEARRYIAGGSWDLRGWPRWSVRGEKLWLSSLEWRFPFINRIRLDFAPFGITLPSIRMAAFIDAGGAWDTQYKETLGSVGIGWRFNFFNAMIFRYDFGKKIENNFTSFQPRWFWQFWFGWDF